MSSSAIMSSTVNSPWSREDLGAALVAEVLGDLAHLVLEDPHPLLPARQDALQFLDRGPHLSQLGFQLLDLEAGELREPHVEDGVRLLLGELEACAKLPVGVRRVLGTPDDLDHLVDVVDGDLESLEDVLPGLGGIEVELGAPGDHLVPVVDVPVEDVLQVHDLRRAVVEREHDDAEGGLHRGVLVQLVQHHVRDRIALELDDDPHAVLVGLVVHPRDALELLLRGQLCDRPDQVLLVHLVGNFRHHDLRLARRLVLLDLRPRPHDHAAATVLVRLRDALPAVDVAAGGEVGPRDHLPQVGDGGIGVVHQQLDPLRHLAKVVRRDVGGHADRDAAGAVDEEVRDAGREDRRFLQAVVVIGLESNGVLLDVVEHRHRDARQACLGVPVCRGGIAVDRAEVALPVHQRIAQRELLHHAHHGVVHRRVAVRVILAQHVAHHRRGLLVPAARHEPEFVHRVENAPVHRLEAVSHVGQRARHDDAHRVVDERLLHFLFDEARNDPFAAIRCGHERPGSGGSAAVLGRP